MHSDRFHSFSRFAFAFFLSSACVLAQQPAVETTPAPAPAPSPLRLIDISFVSLNDFSASTAGTDDFRMLHFGHHDPKNRGFTAANQELALAGIVDPYFRGDAYLVYGIDEEGESSFELEEAFFSTLALPNGLKLRGGQFFNAFGRQNSQHSHSWSFADQPVVLSRMFGPDGLRGPGAELSYLLPLPFFAQATVSVQNSFGETAFSFGNEAGEMFAGRTLLGSEVHNPGDMLYLAKLQTAFEPCEEVTIAPGFSMLYGPNSSGMNTDTIIAGVDLYVKWKPLDAKQGFPFVAFQTEALYRHYEAGEDTAAALPEDILHDWGQYAQLVWGFRRGWVAGFRYDFARGSGGEGDFLRDRRTRLSPNLTFYPSEFSKVRLQYNYDNATFLDEPSHSVILQCEISFGAHGAHKF